YSIDWYGNPDKDDGGWSLEIINPFTGCSGAQNWSASEAFSGGTPGAENSIFDDTPDTTPPSFVGFLAEAPDVIVLQFNELMDEQSLTEGIYAFAAGILVDEAQPLEPPTGVRIFLSEPLEIGQVYNLTLSGLADCSLNDLPEIEVQIQLGVAPELYDILISEIMADPTPAVGLPPAEYFELYNASDNVIELAGCNFSGSEFTNSRLVQPGEYVLCVGEGQQFEFLAYSDLFLIEGLSATFLTNSGRELLLTNPEGQLVDRVNYNISWYNESDKEDGGWSFERINLEEPCRGSDNWTASTALLGGTPGEENTVNSDEPDTTSPGIVIALVPEPTQIEVRFSEVIDPESVSLAEFDLNGITVIDAEAIAPDNLAMLLTLGSALQEGTVYTLKVTGVTDCTGNLIEDEAEVRLAVPQPGAPGDILINEVLFNSGNDGVDFIEIVNVSDKSVGLQGWELLNVNLVSREITEDPLAIFPGEYMVFTSDIDQLMVQFPLGRREKFVESGTPQLTNAGGAVIVNNDLGENIDRFDYSEDYHLSLLRSYTNVSLERLSFTRPTNDGGNWSSAAENVGFATPGYLNSQFLPEGRAEGTFELENEVFSPDNDGFQDVLLINYKLDNPGFIATIQIFDRRGRKVRDLVNNQIIGTEGTISWDGTTDTRTKARIGPHIVLVQLFDLDGNQEVFKMPCVVAGRLGN
ncbi:MAG: lamin tail domain-containing protein, partial [Flavobacteriales bacterium]|nr:lamin tail domain-containing protein [Flavobacteriales bacterium]